MTETKIRNFPRSLPLALASVARLVPGYRGYAEKEDRRDEDKRLRAQVVRCLRDASHDLHRAVRGAPFEGTPPGLARMGDLSRRLDRLIEDVARSAAVHPQFFAPGRVDESRLELLYRADIAVAESVQGLTAEVEAWVAHPDLEADGHPFAAVESALDLAEMAWTARQEMLARE
jgi:hypothetical protein